MIEYKYESMIYKAWEPGYEVGGYSVLDVDSIDLFKYPKVKDVPWSFVTINAGDCLFLPKSESVLNCCCIKYTTVYLAARLS